MTPCAVKWCTALTDGQLCVVHEQFLHLRPLELDEEDVELMLTDVTVSGLTMAGSFFRHPKCVHCCGSGECPECNGDSSVEEECERCGHTHDCECSACDGSGECEHCHGSGETNATFQHPEEWRWDEEYRQKRKREAA